jgi:acetone carboxylase gamma subunit
MDYICITKPVNNHFCEVCNYKTSRKNDLLKHFNTNKHIKQQNNYNTSQQEIDKIYKCKCGNSYKYRQGLHKHKKECNFKSNDDKIAEIYIIIEKQQKHIEELQKQIEELKNKP